MALSGGLFYCPEDILSTDDTRELERKIDIVIEQLKQLIDKQGEHGERLKTIEAWQKDTQSFIDRVMGGRILTTWILTVFAGAGGVALALAHIFWPAPHGRH